MSNRYGLDFAPELDEILYDQQSESESYENENDYEYSGEEDYEERDEEEEPVSNAIVVSTSKRNNKVNAIVPSGQKRKDYSSSSSIVVSNSLNYTDFNNQIRSFDADTQFKKRMKFINLQEEFHYEKTRLENESTKLEYQLHRKILRMGHNQVEEEDDSRKKQKTEAERMTELCEIYDIVLTFCRKRNPKLLDESLIPSDKVFMQKIFNMVLDLFKNDFTSFERIVKEFKEGLILKNNIHIQMVLNLFYAVHTIYKEKAEVIKEDVYSIDDPNICMDLRNQNNKGKKKGNDAVGNNDGYESESSYDGEQITEKYILQLIENRLKFNFNCKQALTEVNIFLDKQQPTTKERKKRIIAFKKNLDDTVGNVFINSTLFSKRCIISPGQSVIKILQNWWFFLEYNIYFLYFTNRYLVELDGTYQTALQISSETHLKSEEMKKRVALKTSFGKFIHGRHKNNANTNKLICSAVPYKTQQMNELRSTFQRYKKDGFYPLHMDIYRHIRSFLVLVFLCMELQKKLDDTKPLKEQILEKINFPIFEIRGETFTMPQDGSSKMRLNESIIDIFKALPSPSSDTSNLLKYITSSDSFKEEKQKHAIDGETPESFLFVYFGRDYFL
tara:strand:- start:291 stop:2135 length:1845 start_codon:yes stop_codon:yes gene_type:complete